MRNRWIGFAAALAVFGVLTMVSSMVPSAAAQRPIQNPINGKPASYFVPAPFDLEFDPHDFSGIWFRVGGERSHGPERSNPPLTPEGVERMKMNHPTRSYLPEITKAVSDPTESNYPAIDCNPKGFPAMVVDDNHDHHEVVMLPSRIFQIWQEERMLREIWLDGRPVPSGSNYRNLGPSWMGMSVGHWEGNTLVVETVGLDDRAWLDTFAFPKSEQTRIIERYTRTDPETLELEMILYDPTYYTEPWISDIKTWRKETRNSRAVNNFGWYGLFSGLTDLLCAPMNGTGTPSNPRGGN